MRPLEETQAQEMNGGRNQTFKVKPAGQQKTPGTNPRGCLLLRFLSIGPEQLGPMRGSLVAVAASFATIATTTAAAAETTAATAAAAAETTAAATTATATAVAATAAAAAAAGRTLFADGLH